MTEQLSLHFTSPLTPPEVPTGGRKFPGGAVAKNPPANAGGMASKIPHVAEQLSPCATTTEPLLQSPHAATTEAHAHMACAPQHEKPPQGEAQAPQRRVAPTRCNQRKPT